MSPLIHRLTAVVMTAVLLASSVATVSAAVWTDQYVYNYGDTVLIGGDGMAPGETVSVDVRFPDGSLAQHHEVTADENGNFSDTFVLAEGMPAGDYEVIATGHESGNVFTTIFDPPNFNAATLTSPTTAQTVDYSDYQTFSGTVSCTDASGPAANKCTTHNFTFALELKGGAFADFTAVETDVQSIQFAASAGLCSTACTQSWTFHWQAGRTEASATVDPGTYTFRVRVTPPTGNFLLPSGSGLVNGLTVDKEDTTTTYGGDTSAPLNGSLNLSADVDDQDGGGGPPGNGEFSPDDNLAGTNKVTFELLVDDTCNGANVAGPVSANIDNNGNTTGSPTLDLTGVPAGTYDLKTTYLGNDYYKTSSDCDSITVLAPAGDPDLTATKSNDAPSSTVNLGDSFAWMIRVENIGDGAASFADADDILTDDLTPGPTYDNLLVNDSNVTTGSVDCSIASNVLTCEADGAVSMAAGDYFDVSFDVTPTANEIGTLDNPVASGACEADPVDLVAEDNGGGTAETNNSCSDSVTVTAPDLTATKTNDTDDGFVHVGDTFQWEIEVANEGDGAAEFADTEVILVDDLPSGPGYANVTVNDSGLSAGSVDCSITSDTVTCSADGAVTIDAGESFTVTFDVTPTSGEIGTLDNPDGTCEADPGNDVPESDEGNNTCSDSLTVVPEIEVVRGNCTFDLNPDTSSWLGDQFRLIYTPQMVDGVSYSKLNASNPGQFFIDVFYIGDGGEQADVYVPYPFVTQGAMPVHFYDGVTITTNSVTCYEPGDSLGASDDMVALIDYAAQNDFTDNYAELEIDVPTTTTGFVLIRIHIDYGLKWVAQQCTKDTVSQGAPYVKANCLGYNIFDNQAYVFGVGVAFEGTDTIYSQNIFKKDPGIGGLVIAASGEPIAGVQVQIWQGTALYRTVYTDEDGWYMAAFKYTGKATTFTVKLPAYGLQQSVTLKSNGYGIVNFTGL